MDESHLLEMREDILGEVSNVILNGCVSSLADGLRLELDSQTPVVRASAHHLAEPKGGDVELLTALALIESPCGQLKADAMFILDLIPTANLEAKLAAAQIKLEE